MITRLNNQLLDIFQQPNFQNLLLVSLYLKSNLHVYFSYDLIKLTLPSSETFIELHGFFYTKKYLSNKKFLSRAFEYIKRPSEFFFNPTLFF